MTHHRPFLPDQRAKGAATARSQTAYFLAAAIRRHEQFLAEAGAKPTDDIDMDVEFMTGSLVFLELVRADLIASGHMTAEDFDADHA